MNPMLRIENLSINNFATIKHQSVDFTEGFNVIVGETGSGKSLILDALQLTFGARADKKLVRKGSSFASVEVSFKIDPKAISKVSKFCDDIGYPTEDEIHIKRVIYKEGNSKAFLNHQSCPISQLTSFTRKFIDLVGQFENQKLLSSEYQLRLLDSYAKLGSDFKKYSELFNLLKDLEGDLTKLENKFLNREREIDFLEFQLKEFKELNPTQEEEEQLIKDKEFLLNSEKITKLGDEFRYMLFEENDGGIVSRINQFTSSFSSTPITELETVSEKLRSIESNLYELEEIVRNSCDNNISSEQSLEDIIDLLDRYQKLKRKFNLPTSELQQKCLNLNEELVKFLDIENEISLIKSKITDSKELCLNIALELHKNREVASLNLSREITESIQKLNMEGATIKFNCQEDNNLSINGLTNLKLTAETNPGEGFYNLSDIASGGELSRILLSLRHLMTAQDSISVFLFDEIDTGIGGKTALKIGEMLSEISQKSQVIAITHLPQIASFADNLVVVEKETKDQRTESKIINCDKKTKIKYISEMANLSL